MSDFASIRSNRGFALMVPDRRKEIARMGGKAIPKDRRAFSQDPDLARRAGQAGGYRRREANDGDAALMHKMLAEPRDFSAPLSGRMTRRIARLLKLKYIVERRSASTKERRFALTDEGRAFLAARENAAPSE